MRRPRSLLKGPASRNIVRIAAPFLIAAVLLSVGFVRPRAEFDLVLRLDHLSFEIDHWGERDTGSLFDPVEMGVQIAGFRSLELGAGSIASEGSAQPSSSTTDRTTVTTVLPSGPLPDMKLSRAALHELTLSPGTRVILDWRPQSPQQYALSIALASGQPEPVGTLELPETLSIECRACTAVRGTDPAGNVALSRATFTSSTRHLATFSGNGARVILWPDQSLVRRDNDILLKARQRIETFALEDNRPKSSVIGDGQLIFTALRTPVPIRPGDFVVVDGTGTASITSLAIENGIQVTIHGVADSIRLGSRVNSLAQQQPSLFEHVTARKDLTTYYTGIGVLGSIILSALARLAPHKKKE